MGGPNFVTSAGLAALQAELHDLEGSARRELAERIKTAREWGDLKENAEYHDAKNEQAHLETRIARLRDRIASAEIRDGAPDSGAVSFGSTVVLAIGGAAEQRWTIVASHEADPRAGRLSSDSPIARAVLGRSAGDEIVVELPRGPKRVRIVSLL